jgi:hypothetical protein
MDIDESDVIQFFWNFIIYFVGFTLFAWMSSLILFGDVQHGVPTIRAVFATLFAIVKPIVKIKPW